MAKKPLVFVEPLSPTFKKLQEVLTPIAESEGIEIFTTADINEAMQLIPNIGPSLTLLSDAKVTAVLLKGQGKKIAKQNSKIMLLSKQKIPQKSLEKMMKYGLSECVVEPIQPKSLLYKVKLLLRSLPSQDKKEKELSLKTTETAKKEADKKEENVEKVDPTPSAESLLPEEEKEKKQSTPTAEEDAYLQGEVKNKTNDSEIDSHYKGKTSKDKTIETEEDLYKRPEKEKEKAIESHYKGSLSENEKKEEENNNEIKNVNKDIIDDRLEGKIGEKALEFEKDDQKENDFSPQEDIYKDNKIKKSQSLDLDLDNEEAEEESNEKQVTEDDKYLKGKILEAQTEKEEEYNSKKSQMGTPSDPNFKSKFNDNTLQLEEEEEEDKDQKKNGQLSFEKEDQKTPKEGQVQNESDTPNQKESNDKTLAEAEDYLKEYKSKNKQEGDLEADKDMYQKNEDKKEKDLRSKNSSGLDLEQDEASETSLQDDDNKEESKNKKNKQQGLSFEQETTSTDEQEQLNDPQDIYKKNESKIKQIDESDLNNPELQESIKSSEEKNENSIQKPGNTEEDEIKKKKDKSGKLALEQDDYYQKEKEQIKEEEAQKKDWTQRAEEEKKVREKESLAEQEMEWKDINLDKKKEIDEVKKSKKEEEESHWENIKINKKQEIQESEKSQYDKEMIIKKEERGEQTIDYAKLKEEFGIIDKYGRDAIKNAYSFEETGGTAGSYSQKVRGSVPYSVEISETPEEKKKEEDVISSLDFPPDGKGLEHAINILNFIENKNIKEEEIFVQICQTILQEYLGHSVFFRSNIKTYEMEKLFQVNSDYIRQQYETFKHLYFDMWKSIPLPYWSDETFQSKEMFFIFPFFEGTKSLGFAVSFFPQGIKQEIAPRVEILFECARTLYLDYAHDNATKGTYISLIKKAPEKEETAVAKVFGKLTSWFKKAG